MRTKQLLFFTILLTYSAIGNTPIEYYHTLHYTSEMGLPHSLVFDIAQGKDGFIWIATNNGLGRFDGYNFKTYRPKQSGEFNISGKSVNRLMLDNKNNLWLGIQGIGLNRMDLATERFYEFNPNSNYSNSISGNNIECLFQDSDSIIWIGTNKGLDFFDMQKNKFISLIEPSNDDKNRVHRIDEDLFGRIWFNSPAGLSCYNRKTNVIQSIYEVVKENWVDSIRINATLLENNKYFWIVTQNKGLLCYNIETNRLEYEYNDLKDLGSLFINKKGDVFVLSNNEKNKLLVIPFELRKEKTYKTIFEFPDKKSYLYADFCEDSKGDTYVSGEFGLLKIYPNLSAVAIKSTDSNGINLLERNIFIDFIDQMGNLWMRSERNGIIMIDLNQKQFFQYNFLSNENPIISGDNISMVYEDSHSKIWVGCYGEGITCYDRLTKTHISIPYVPTDISKIIFKAPSAMCEDSEGYLWLGFYDGGLLRINPNTMAIEYFFGHFVQSQKNEIANCIRSIVLDKDNNLWFSTNSSGIMERKQKTGEFIFHSELYEEDFRSNSHYRFLIQTLDGIFWTGTQNGGLGKYNKETHEFIHFKNDPANKNTISGHTVYFVHEQSDSILWVGTDKGLNKFNRNTQKFTCYQNFRSDFICAIYRIYPDRDNNLWLSGDCGIIKFNLETYESKIYTKSDGLPASEFNTTAGCITKQGEIFFGSTMGLISFYPDNIYPNPYPSKAKISQLKIFNKNVSPGEKIKNITVLDKEISLIDHITLPYYLNDFTLEFTALHFASPLKNRYWYKLEGFNNEWIETDANRRWANFTGLKPGTYVFYLKTSNNDGLMNTKEGETSLTIEIKPPFNETIWFRSILILIIILSTYLIYKIRLRNINLQKKILSETVAERTTELQNKNALLEERQEEISLQNEELEKHRNHLEEMVIERTEEMKIALLKAEESDRLKSAFLSNMSHEIRTPMNAILGFSNLLLESSYTDEERADFVQIIHSNGETLLNLLNDIIDVSIIESGQLKINKKETDLNKLVNEVFTSFTNNNELRPKPELQIELKAPNKTIRVNTDPVRLKQILNNIIGNAIKYTKAGLITLHYDIESEKVEFSITDSGIGIDAEKIQHIFNRFNKIDSTQSEIYRGGGLGLAISKNLVEVLGGEIWVKSKPNFGSTFYFTIDGILNK